MQEPSRPASLRLLRLRRAAVDALSDRRRVLQLALGLIWLLDAALQFQPFMFSRSFVTQIIQPTGEDGPRLVQHSIGWASEIMLQHIAVFNAVFASIQLLLALGLVFRRTVKVSLAASIVWALFVWWFGEGFGGIFTGDSPVSGMPGVVLYVLIAVLLWPTARTPRSATDSVATTGPLGAVVPKALWLTLWGSFAYFLLLPDNRASDGISQILAFTVGQPGWLTSIMDDLSRLAGDRGVEISIVLAVLCVLVAVGVMARATLRAALVLAMALGLGFWVAQGLGGIFTGQGTDPNTGPLLVLLAACYWPVKGAVSRRRPDPSEEPDALRLAPWSDGRSDTPERSQVRSDISESTGG
jgi:hypothetical protein